MASTVVDLDPGPTHPSESLDGPKHEVEGVIRSVTCSYPSVMEFRVEGDKKAVTLYSNDYFKLEFSTLGFMPTGDLHPCKDIEGMKARVRYAESSDKTVDGQLVSIILKK
jgi:hypothetical protein